MELQERKEFPANETEAFVPDEAWWRVPFEESSWHQFC
jgi:hypothetical protein